MPKKKQRFRLTSRMSFGEPETTVMLDPSDRQVRGWLRAGNIRPVKKKVK